MASVPKTVSSKAEGKLGVAFCHPDLGIGGAERLVVDAALALSERGHDVQIFTAHHDPSHCFPETLSGKFKVHVYGDFLPRHIFGRFHALCAYIRCLWVALCMVLYHSASFQHVFVDQVSAVIPVLKWKKGVKVLFYCHFPDLLLAQHGPKWSLRALYRAPIDWLEETTTGMADCVVVNSMFTAATFKSTFKQLAARGLSPAVLYPAVPLPEKNSAGASKEFGDFVPNKPFFLSLNRYERKKEIEIAIKAVAVVKDKSALSGLQGTIPSLNKDVELVVAGGYDVRLPENVEYLEELRTLARTQKVSDSVHFLTSISNAHKALLLRKTLAVLYTPQREHFGLVPIEAMAYGVPVVACNSGGPTESILDGVTGILCEPTGVSFGVAMGALLSDEEKRLTMGDAARKRVETMFSWETFSGHLERLLENL